MSVHEPHRLAGEFAERVNSADLDGVVALYEPGAMFVGGDGTCAAGHAEIRRTLREMLAARPRITGVVTEASFVAEDVALLCNRWQMTFGALAEAEAVRGSSVEVARRQTDGTWLYAIDRPRADASR
jgi:uncharacterized protein (TIGR02246 family)